MLYAGNSVQYCVYTCVVQCSKCRLVNVIFCFRISSSYEVTVPSVCDKLSKESVNGVDCTLVQELRSNIQLLRAITLATFRLLLNSLCFEPLEKENSTTHQCNECLESYLQLFSTCMAEKIFIADYHSSYDFKKDVEKLEFHTKDTTSLQYIVDAMEEVLKEVNVTWGLNDFTPKSEKVEKSSEENEDNTGMSHYAMTGSSHVDHIQLAELVSSVQDLMPTLGNGFVTACLKHYRYSAEAVINAICEESLPPELASMDRTLASVDLPPEPPAMTALLPDNAAASAVPDAYTSSYEKSVDEAKLGVMNRANIYNDDEFDVFSNKPSIDLSKVRKGKKKKDLLEEDSDVKDRVRALGHMYEERHGRSIYEEDNEEAVGDEMGDEELYLATVNYDDEYDDTYDDNEAGNVDAKTDQITLKRLGNRPTIFGRGSLNTPLADDPGSAEEEQSEGTESVLPSEETEEEFLRRRGLRKGQGGVQYIMELRESGGVIKRTAAKVERNLPSTHSHNNMRRRAEHRHKPVDYHKDHHKPIRNYNTSNNIEEEDTSTSCTTGESMPKFFYSNSETNEKL